MRNPSAIVVGYAPAELQKNGLTAGTCFIPVSGADVIDLTELTVTGYEGDTKAKVEVQTLNDAGGTVASYYWYDYVNNKGKHIIGWMDDEDEIIEEGVVTPITPIFVSPAVNTFDVSSQKGVVSTFLTGS